MTCGVDDKWDCGQWACSHYIYSLTSYGETCSSFGENPSKMSYRYRWADSDLNSSLIETMQLLQWKNV